MNADDKELWFIIEKVALPLVAALISWFVKDYLVGEFSRREQAVQSEWKYRLTEIWDPLFYWIPICLFNSKNAGWEKHGMLELESLVIKAAHLLPLRHYNTLVYILEHGTGQRSHVTLKQIQETRDFVYRQIEAYNYLLYRRTGWFDLANQTDLFGTYRGILRVISLAIFHLATWALVFASIAGLYIAYLSAHYWIIIAVAILLLFVALIDARQRWRLYSRISEAVRAK